MFARILTAGLLLASLSLAGCASLSEAVRPEPKVVTEKALIAKPDADVVGELAPGLPDGVPLWPGAEVKASRAIADAYNMTLTAKEPYDDVLAGMAAGFTEAGWTVEQEDTGESGARIAVLTVGGPSAEGILTVTEISDGTVDLAYVLTTAL